MKQCIAIIALMTSVSAVFAQQELKGANMRFEAKTLSVDTISEDDPPVSCTFTFTNTTDNTLSLLFVKTGCGCTTSTYTPTVIRAGKKGSITLTFHPKHRPGKVREQAFVYTNLSQQIPTAVLTITGFVTPTRDQWSNYRHRAGVLCLMRTGVTFKGQAVDGKAEERILCANSGTTPVRLSATKGTLPDWLQLRTDPAVVPPGTEFDLVLTADASRLPKNRSNVTTASVILDGISSTPSQRTLTITVNPDFK